MHEITPCSCKIMIETRKARFSFENKPQLFVDVFNVVISARRQRYSRRCVEQSSLSLNMLLFRSSISFGIQDVLLDIKLSAPTH